MYISTHLNFQPQTSLANLSVSYVAQMTHKQLDVHILYGLMM